MIEEPPPRPGGASRKQDLILLRIANLCRELDAETEPMSQAAILYRIGALYEHELAQASEAAEHYGRAHSVAPGFQPALIARLRLAERSKDPDLATLRDEHAASARSPAISAAALVDLAIDSEDGVSLLEKAIARSPAPVVPALVLEWLADARGEEDAVRHALRVQAEHATDRDLRAALWIDVALSEIDAGHPDEAIDALERACESEAVIWQARSLQLRTAREHERWEVFVRAATSMAELLEAAVRGGGPSDPLSLSVPPEERLALAAFMWQEAATCSEIQLDDADAAAGYLDASLRLCPERRSARLQALLVEERRGDEAASRRASEWFLAEAPEDAAFVAHEVRRALSGADLQEATETLWDAAARIPDSGYARAALDVALIRGGAHAERAERLCREADAAVGDDRARLKWHAAQLMTMSAATSSRAQALYEEAALETTSSKSQIVREALGAALYAKQTEMIQKRCEDLLGCDIEPVERAMLELSRYEMARNTSGASEESELLLREALSDPNNRAWAPHVARAHAAWAGNAGLLAEAHEAIAELTSGDLQVAHLCAAAQAYARSRNWEGAERALREALRASPDDRYVVSLLDGVLREGGRPEAVVSLARERSGGEPGAALGALSLLLAGATAERDGNWAAARHAYEQALLEAPRSPSAALALLDVARRQNDEQGLARAYAHLSDADLGGGISELYALLRGDALGSGSEARPAASDSYQRALDHPATALAAAIALLSMPPGLATADQRSAAEEALADAEPPRETQSAFGTAYGVLRASLEERSSSASDAWLQLASSAPNESLRAEVLVQGLRAARVVRGVDAADELFMLAQEAEDLAELNADAATAIDEALAPGDDAELRANALATKRKHSEALGRGALDAAYCRALVEADRGAEAVALLTDTVDERPDDLALWETLRGAGRQAEQWPVVAQACERLAAFVDGPLRGDLLEEAGVVRLECLAQHQQAEDLFREAPEEDPTRDIAFRRLHDLLAHQEDADALEALISRRLAVGSPNDRLDLLYERARLLRGFSDRPGTLDVLRELFTSEPDHAGALALAAEVHVSLEHWPEAVDCLQRLSKAAIPPEQRRLAHLGAADFLESHLGAPDRALAELRAVEALGVADAQTWTRIGAIEASLQNRGAAIAGYSAALKSGPTHAAAISGLVELLDETDADQAVASYERAIWERIEGGGLDAASLEALAQAATWRGHRERVAAARAVQSTLGLTPSAEGGGALHLGHVAGTARWDREADPVLHEVVRHAGPALSRDRVRTRAAAPDDPVYAELERLSQRLGARVGSIGLSDDITAMIARTGRDGEIDWVAPRSVRAGLDAGGRFVAGRLAWAAPLGAAWMLEDTAETVAGILAAVLRAARCELGSAGPILPAANVKLRRAVRKAIHEAVGDTQPEPSSLLGFARSVQRTADRAGLLASGELGAGLATLLHGTTTLEALRTSPRARDLLRFGLDADSALWRNDG